VTRKLNESSLALLKEFEGLRLRAYRDVAGYWTVGYGHLITKREHLNAYELDKYSQITENMAEDLLKSDLSVAKSSVLNLIRVPLNDNQFGSLVSFTYNLGSGALQRSTLRSKLNRGDYDGAAFEFPKWVYAGGRVVRGLVRRRWAEVELYYDYL